MQFFMKVIVFFIVVDIPFLRKSALKYILEWRYFLNDVFLMVWEDFVGCKNKIYSFLKISARPND